MPIYEYCVREGMAGCEYCSRPFELMQRLSDPPLAACPKCGAPVQRLISAISIGYSKSGFDRRAREAGFTKLQRIGRGEYEKKY